MSVLIVNEQAGFNELKDYLDATDGNLASHLRVLESLNYISVKKQFKGRKPNTTYTITPEGRMAFRDHLSALEKLISSTS